MLRHVPYAGKSETTVVEADPQIAISAKDLIETFTRGKDAGRGKREAGGAGAEKEDNCSSPNAGRLTRK